MRRALPSPSNSLEYASGDRWHWRHSTLRRVVVVASLLLVAAALLACAPPMWSGLRIWYFQRRCMNFVPPAQWRVSLTERPVPAVWNALAELVSPPGIRSQGTVFLGRRDTPAGDECLLAVDVLSDSGGFFLVTRALRPGSALRRPVEFALKDNLKRIPSCSVLRFGVPDQLDPTHVQIPCTADGRQTWIDLWIRDHTVITELRPADAPQSPSASAVTVDSAQ